MLDLSPYDVILLINAYLVGPLQAEMSQILD